MGKETFHHNEDNPPESFNRRSTDNKEDISIVAVYTDLKLLGSELFYLRKDFNEKHAENKEYRHGMRNDIQDLRDEIWKLKIKIAGWSAIGGVVAGIAMELIKALFSKMIGGGHN